MEDPFYRDLISSRDLADLMTHLMWWAAVVWLAAVGGCVGSFLNVVWDRWGTGEGFVFRPSHCAVCQHRIRWYHNVPILGWLLLGGRCYDCKAPIPAKHLTVEVITALVFVAGGLATWWMMN